MRILHSLEGRSWSGGQQQALFLAKGQIEEGHDILLMCQAGSELEKRAKDLRLPVLPHDYQKELHPISIIGLLRAFNSFKPDVVNVHRAWAHTQWVMVSLLKKFRGLIVTRRVIFKSGKNPLSLVKYRTPAVRGYIAVSNSVSDLLSEIGVSDKKIRVVYSATDTDYFDPQRKHFLESDLPFGDNEEVILLIGNYHRNKGHLILIEAFEHLVNDWPNARLVFAGTGTTSGELAHRAQNSARKERIHLLGFRRDIPALLSRSCTSVNASLEEGFSGTLRESLAMKIVSVASDIPSNRELSNHVPMILFKSGSVSDLVRSLLISRETIKNLDYRNNLRKRVIQAFSVKSMVKKTICAYKNLLKEKP